MKRIMTIILSVLLLIAFSATSIGLTSIPVKSIKLSETEIKINVGQTKSMKVTFTPSNATNKRVTYTTANRNIATVDKNGNVKGIKPGKTVITVTALNNVKTKCNVTVSQTQNSWDKYKSKPVTLKMYINGAWSGYLPVYGKNWLSNKMIEDTGVTLDFILDPDFSENGLNLLVASGDYPDIMYMRSDRTAYNDLIKNGVFYDLDELEGKTGIDLAATMDAEMRAEDRMRFDTLKLYGIRSFGTVPQEKRNDKYTIKNEANLVCIKDIYKEAGSPKIKTGEDFLNLLRKVKKKHPDMEMVSPVAESSAGNIPFILTILAEHAGFKDFKSWNKPEYKYDFWQTPQALEALKLANTIWNEKLMYPTSLTDKKDQLDANLLNGKVFSYLRLDYDRLEERSALISKVRPDTELMPLPYFSIGSVGMVEGGNYGIGGWLIYNVVKSTKNPERCAAFIDYMASEYFQKMNIFGQEGVHHTVKNGWPVLNKELVDLMAKDYNAFKEKYGLNFFDGIFRDSYWANVQRMISASPINRSAIDMTRTIPYKSTVGVAEAQQILYPTDSEENKISANIREIFATEITKIMIGEPKNVVPDFKKLLSKMRQMDPDDKLLKYKLKKMEDYKQNFEKLKY
jgi:putative aldouronate transport system substrate-binding protein